MKFGSLFSGIGGLDLGLERAGMECAWQVEIDDDARADLERNFPRCRRWADVRTFPPAEGDWKVDLIAAGFPCQDISAAGRRAGIHGERSGLFFEIIRLARLLQPRMMLLENVPNLLADGMGVVLGELASCGFDAEWCVLPASAFGAPHQRARLFILAYASGVGLATARYFTPGALASLGEELVWRTRRWGGVRKSSASHPDRIRLFPEPGICPVADGIPDRVDER